MNGYTHANSIIIIGNKKPFLKPEGFYCPANKILAVPKRVMGKNNAPPILPIVFLEAE